MALKDKYFTISEAAQELGVTRQTISRWIASGKVPAEKVGRATLIEKDDLEHYDSKRFGESMRDKFTKRIIRTIRQGYGYTRDDNIKLLNIRGRHTEHRFGKMVFSVDKEEGTQEEVQVEIGTVDWSKDDPLMIEIEIRKITRKKTK